MHPKQEELEKKITSLARALDIHLEETFGKDFPLHPNRLAHGSGSNPMFDGLFSTTIAFTLGLGSPSGRGYVVDISIRTLEKIPQEEKDFIYEEAFAYLQASLPTAFEDRKLEIIKEGNVLKIIGDFSLGSL